MGAVLADLGGDCDDRNHLLGSFDLGYSADR
jgi:hypothetical protein